MVATSSRLMTASLGAWVAKRRDAMLYLDIRDLFTDTMEDVLASLRGLLPGFRALERWTFRAARQMNVVSAGFCHISKGGAGFNSNSVHNGIDPTFVRRTSTQSTPAEAVVMPAIWGGGLASHCSECGGGKTGCAVQANWGWRDALGVDGERRHLSMSNVRS